MKKSDKAANAIFLTGLAVCVIVLIADICIGRSKAEATQETTGEPTLVFYEEVEPAPEETIAAETAEATEPKLYDVPLEEDLQIFIIGLCEEKHIDPAIILAMAFRESTYRADAIGDGGNSYGLLQIQPKWHYGRMQKLGCTDLLDPYQNVTVAIDYLCELLNRYGSIDKALTAYNRGSYEGTVTEYAKTIMNYAEGLVN